MMMDTRLAKRDVLTFILANDCVTLGVPYHTIPFLSTRATW